MDGEISIPRNLQTDRIAAAVSKREGRSGNPRRFEAELSHKEKSSEEPARKDDAEKPGDDPAAESQSEASASTAAPGNGDLLDFEA